MNRLNFPKTITCLIAVYATCFTILFDCLNGHAVAQDSDASKSEPAKKYGVWEIVKDESGKNDIRRMHLRVYPAAAPKPAFKHRLVPAAKERVDGNSALFYLKAMGFFEQRNAREALTKLERKWREEATPEQRSTYDYAPHTLQGAAPESLPMEQAKEYLDLLDFQTEFLYDAARRTRFEHDRAIERESNPIGYLLPSIQGHRNLARVQDVRCRYAIAQGRIDDAIEIVGQMMTMGRHLGSDEFLVTCLVGAAIHGIGIETAFELSQHPETPNLYWAIAASPTPVINLSRAFAFEREFLYLQIPMLKEVTAEVRPPDFWVSSTKQFIKGYNNLIEVTDSWGNPKSKKLDHFQLATTIARDYPVAREFLKEFVGLSDTQLDKYPKAQVVFLAAVNYYDFASDEAMKQLVMPSSSRHRYGESELLVTWRKRFAAPQAGSYKSLPLLGELLAPASRIILGAVDRIDQQQNLWQTVEALRMTAAENGGVFPKSLDQLCVPAPLDPLTNRPFEYELDAGIAILRGARGSQLKYVIYLELANQNQQESAK